MILIIVTFIIHIWYLFLQIDMCNFNKVINSNFPKYKNQLILPHYVDAKYFQTLTKFVIRNNHLLHYSKIYLQKAGNRQGGCT